MKKKFTVAILGTGGRGYAYGTLLAKMPNEFEVTALCDINPEQLKKENRLFNLPESAMFTSDTEFFKEKRADIVVIATWDKYHVEQCLTAMKLGCDVLLEKPVSDSEKEIAELLRVQKETGRKVIVCHVLRYGAGYRKLDELLQSGIIGTLTAIDATERVAYWHQAQAYVRLQSEHNFITHPTILAKCCHDLDYIQHYAGAKCETVSSLGGLDFFLPKNATSGASKRCLDCKHADTCVYSAVLVYIERWKNSGRPAFDWPYNKVTLANPTTEEALYEGLKTSELGKCAFLTGVEENKHVVDHQTVQMHFANGVDATLRMQYCASSGRRINLFGTYGEILFDEQTGEIKVMPFGKPEQIIPLSSLGKGDGGWGHGGGDRGLIADLYSIIVGEKTDYTSLEESVESHLIGIKAEVSRFGGGVTLKVH